ncbi:MAG TPA: 2'-5' RNA ligase family protein [Candidatus Saccharimonadales bacterium]
MHDARHLYLFTLEVVPLTVGATYNPLPSHLTLMSRFWSGYSPEALIDLVKPLFERTKPIELLFGQPANIGPKHTAVHLIEHRDEIRHLHNQLCRLLDNIAVEYTNPQFVGNGHKPHVSRRDGDGFAPGRKQIAKVVYLIEVEIRGDEHLRFVHAKFDLQA